LEYAGGYGNALINLALTEKTAGEKLEKVRPRLEEAIRVLDQASIGAPRSGKIPEVLARAWYGMGALLCDMGLYKESLEALNRSQTLGHPLVNLVRFRRAITLLELEDHKRAVEDARALGNMKPLADDSSRQLMEPSCMQRRPPSRARTPACPRRNGLD
jgi:tetratricopeptide (TPR) repeat protein